MTQSIEPDFDITKYHKCLSDLYWFGCYEGDVYFKQYFEPSTYAHPAKISPLLADRIFKHLEKLELLKEGMTILDFMVGSGRIPLMASLRGYKGLGVELEPHFVKMCNDNKKFAENKIGRKLDMDIIQGDSRQLSKLLSKSDVAVVSPPFTDQNQGTKPLSERNDGMALRLRKERPNTYDKTGVGSSSKEYSDNPSNIGNLPYKQMVGVVSPPYHDSMSSEKHGIDTTKLQDGIKNPRTKYLNNLEYSQNPENIGNLKDTGSIVGITSPPYEQLVNRDRKNETNAVNKPDFIRGGRSQYETYGNNPQNIANLKDISIENLEDFQAFSKAESFVGITSPPYENNNNNIGGVGDTVGMRQQIHNSKPRKNSYGNSENQLGNQQGQNYLSAMLQVYKEASKVCPIICTVTKNPTRAGKLRRLDLDTAKLLELAGYTIVDYHRAVLFKTYEQSTLIGETKKEHKGRLSFFKRLSLNNGNQAAMWEDVLIGVKNG